MKVSSLSSAIVITSAGSWDSANNAASILRTELAGPAPKPSRGRFDFSGSPVHFLRLELEAELTFSNRSVFPASRHLVLPVVIRSILSRSITMVAFGMTLPSEGLITVPPTREIRSARAFATAKSDSVRAIAVSSLMMDRVFDFGQEVQE